MGNTGSNFNPTITRVYQQDRIRQSVDAFEKSIAKANELAHRATQLTMEGFSAENSKPGSTAYDATLGSISQMMNTPMMASMLGGSQLNLGMGMQNSVAWSGGSYSAQMGGGVGLGSLTENPQFVDLISMELFRNVKKEFTNPGGFVDYSMTSGLDLGQMGTLVSKLGSSGFFKNANLGDLSEGGPDANGDPTMKFVMDGSLQTKFNAKLKDMADITGVFKDIFGGDDMQQLMGKVEDFLGTSIGGPSANNSAQRLTSVLATGAASGMTSREAILAAHKQQASMYGALGFNDATGSILADETFADPTAAFASGQGVQSAMMSDNIFLRNASQGEAQMRTSVSTRALMDENKVALVAEYYAEKYQKDNPEARAEITKLQDTIYNTTGYEQDEARGNLWDHLTSLGIDVEAVSEQAGGIPGMSETLLRSGNKNFIRAMTKKERSLSRDQYEREGFSEFEKMTRSAISDPAMADTVVESARIMSFEMDGKSTANLTRLYSDLQDPKKTEEEKQNIRARMNLAIDDSSGLTEREKASLKENYTNMEEGAVSYNSFLSGSLDMRKENFENFTPTGDILVSDRDRYNKIFEEEALNSDYGPKTALESFNRALLGEKSYVSEHDAAVAAYQMAYTDDKDIKGKDGASLRKLVEGRVVKMSDKEGLRKMLGSDKLKKAFNIGSDEELVEFMDTSEGDRMIAEYGLSKGNRLLEMESDIVNAKGVVTGTRDDKVMFDNGVTQGSADLINAYMNPEDGKGLNHAMMKAGFDWTLDPDDDMGTLQTMGDSLTHWFSRDKKKQMKQFVSDLSPEEVTKLSEQTDGLIRTNQAIADDSDFLSGFGLENSGEINDAANEKLEAYKAFKELLEKFGQKAAATPASPENKDFTGKVLLEGGDIILEVRNRERS